MGHAAIAERRPACPVGDENGVLRSGDFFVVDRQRLHQLHGVDALLVADAAQIMECQPRERDHRRAVERGVVKTIHQMDRARPGGADANAESSGMFGPSGGHEGRGFLMPNCDIADPILALSQGFDDRIDAVADDPEHVGCAPVDQRLDQDVRGRHIGAGHRRRLLRDIGFRFRGLSGRRGAWGGGGQAGRGGDLEKIATIPAGGFVAAHRTCPIHRPVAPIPQLDGFE